MTAQGININVFDGLPMSGMFTVHTATALSAAEMNPVGSFVDRAGKTISFDQGFHQKRAIAVQPLPIIRQATGSERKGHAGKSLNGNISRDEESAIGNNELEIPFSLFGRPSDPGVARRHLPGRTGKLQTSEKLSRRIWRLNEIVQVSSKRDAIVKVMPALDKLLKGAKQFTIRSLNETQRQRLELTGAASDGNRRIALRGRKKNLSGTRGRRIAKFWKDHQSIRLKPLKERTAFFMLQFAVGAFPFQEFAQGLG